VEFAALATRVASFAQHGASLAAHLGFPTPHDHKACPGDLLEAIAAGWSAVASPDVAPVVAVRR
jgi:hypothetical protein